MQLVARALQEAPASELPWIIGVDFQDKPEVVEGWAGEMLGRAGG